MSTDLFGNPIVDPPPMDAPLPWRVFYVNDQEWWLARSLEELRDFYVKACGREAWDTYCQDACEVSDADLDKLEVAEVDEDERFTGGKHSFREELASRSPTEPEFFAGSEW